MSNWDWWIYFSKYWLHSCENGRYCSSKTTVKNKVEPSFHLFCRYSIVVRGSKHCSFLFTVQGSVQSCGLWYWGMYKFNCVVCQRFNEMNLAIRNLKKPFWLTELKIWAAASFKTWLFACWMAAWAPVMWLPPTIKCFFAASSGKSSRTARRIPSTRMWTFVSFLWGQKWKSYTFCAIVD